MDLTKQYPRSPYEKVGGYLWLGRAIDKARAKHANTLGGYICNGIPDEILFQFLGLKVDDFLATVKTHSTDDDILEWIKANQTSHSAEEISEFNEKISNYGPEDFDAGKVDYLKREDYEYEPFRQKWAPKRPDLNSWSKFFEVLRQRCAPDRPDLRTWFDLKDAEEGRLKDKS